MLTGVTTPERLAAVPGRTTADAVAAERRRSSRGCSRSSRGRLTRPRDDTCPATTAAPGRALGPGVELGRSGARSVGVGERDVERPAVDRPQLVGPQPDLVEGGGVFLGQRDVRHREVVGRERDRHAAPVEVASGCAAREATIPAWTLLVGQRSSVTPRADQLGAQAGSSTAPGPWAIRSGSSASARRTCAAPPHSPAWSVIRRPACARRLERRRWSSGSGKAASGPARSKPGQAPVAEPARRPPPARRSRPARASGAPCDQPDVVPVAAAAVRGPVADRGDALGQGQPAAECSSGPQRIST